MSRSWVPRICSYFISREMISRPSSGFVLPPMRLSTVSRTTSKPAFNTSRDTATPIQPSMGTPKPWAAIIDTTTAVVASISEKESFAAAISDGKSISSPTAR